MSSDVAGGTVGRARGLAAVALRALRTRLELAGVEIEQEAARILSRLLLGAAALYMLSFGTLLAIVWVILSLPEHWRAVALGAAALALLFGGVGALAGLSYAVRRRRSPFQATLTVLKRDIEALTRSSR
jgi:uncharacterized membrane protein YqjE